MAPGLRFGRIVVFGLLAEHVHARFRFSRIVLSSLLAVALLIVVFGFLRIIWLAIVVWALIEGFITLCDFTHVLVLS